MQKIKDELACRRCFGRYDAPHAEALEYPALVQEALFLFREILSIYKKTL